MVTSDLSEPLDKETSKYNDTENCFEFNLDDKISSYKTAFGYYKKGNKTDLCPLCLQTKEENEVGGIIDCNSHIFSECFLKSYYEIHHQKSDHDFIYDGISKKHKSSTNLTWILFCRKCETNVADEENLLNQLYLQIAGKDGREITIARANALRVRHILAVILFRGMLLGVDILDEYEDQFWETFLRLREYCSIKFETDGDPPYNLSKFLVYVLSNEHYNKDDPKLWYHMDFSLRNPQLTSMIKINENNVFLYYKMDIFHCMYPIKTDIPIEEDKLFCEFDPLLWEYFIKHSGCQPSHIDRKYKMIIRDPIKMPDPVLPPRSMNVIVLEKCDTVPQANDDLIKEARKKSPIAGRDDKKTEIETFRNKIDSMQGTVQSIKSLYNNNKNKLAKLKTDLQTACKKYNVSLVLQDQSSNQCTESRQTFEEKIQSIVEEIEFLSDNLDNFKSQKRRNKVR